MTPEEQVLKEAAALVERLLDRLQKGVEGISRLRPFDPLTIDDLEDDDAMRIDAFLKRFENSVEAVLRSLFRSLLTILAEDVRIMSQRAMLDRLETLGFIQSADAWLVIVNIRNTIVHEYPLAGATRVQALDAAVTAAVALKWSASAAIAKARADGLIREEN